MPDTLYLTEHFRRQFEDQWNHQVQQAESKFAAAGMVDGTWTAKEKVFTDLSTIEWTENNDRFGRHEPRGGDGRETERLQEIFRKFDRKDKDLQHEPAGLGSDASYEDGLEPEDG